MSGQHVYVRNSQDTEGAPLRFDRAEWGAFVAAVRTGQFAVS